MSLKEERLPRRSLPFKTACHLAALVSVEEEGGPEESWEDEVDEGKKWLVSQLVADVAHCGKQEVSTRFRAASAEHMDSCTVENHTNQRTHRNESHVTINEVQRVPKKWQFTKKRTCLLFVGETGQRSGGVKFKCVHAG